VDAGWLVLDLVAEAAGFDELRDDEVRVVDAAGVVDGDDARVFESRDPAGFGDERIGRIQATGFRQLDGDDAVEFQVEAAPDLGETAFGDQQIEPIAASQHPRFARSEGRKGGRVEGFGVDERFVEPGGSLQGFDPPLQLVDQMGAVLAEFDGRDVAALFAEFFPPHEKLRKRFIILMRGAILSVIGHVSIPCSLSRAACQRRFSVLYEIPRTAAACSCCSPS